MLHRFCYGALLVLLAGGAGCATSRPAPPPQPVTITKDLAYPHSAAELQDAYRTAIVASDLILTADVPGRLDARSTLAGFPATVTVTISPSDTLDSHVHLTSTYTMEGEAYRNFPMDLAYQAWQALPRRGQALSYPTLVFPPTLERCPASSLSGEEMQRATPPSMIGGLRGLTSRVRYTEAARAAGVEGRVYLYAIVGRDGRVTCGQVEMGLPGGLSEQALVLLMASRFEPATLDGEPIDMPLTLPITFRLR